MLVARLLSILLLLLLLIPLLVVILPLVVKPVEPSGVVLMLISGGKR